MGSKPQSERWRNRWLPPDGVTLMIVSGPQQHTRRVHIPRWLLLCTLGSWLMVLAGFAWLGFRSENLDASPDPRAGTPASPGTEDSGEHAQGDIRMATPPSPRSRQ